MRAFQLTNSKARTYRPPLRRTSQPFGNAVVAIGAAAIAIPIATVHADGNLCVGEQHVPCDEQWISTTSPDLFGDPAISGRWAILGKRGDSEAAPIAGAVYFYRMIDGNWELSSKIPHPDPSAEEWLGQSVAIDGNRAVASAAGWNFQTGRILVFERDLNSGEWGWVGDLFLDPPFGQPGDQLGASDDHTACRKGVAISGEIIAAGAPMAGEGMFGQPSHIPELGYVAIFQDGQALIIDSSTFGFPREEGARFGAAVVLDDNRLAIGEPRRNVEPEAGHVYLARHEDGQWISEGVVSSPGLGGGIHMHHGNFGFSLALEGDLLVVGAPSEDQVYLFEYDGSTESWEYSGITIVNPEEPAGFFGIGVALNGSELLIGGGDNLAHLYRRDGEGGWQLAQSFAPPDPTTAVSFGFSLALDRNGAIIADFNESHFDDQGNVFAPKGGIAYFFRRLPSCNPYVPSCGN